MSSSFPASRSQSLSKATAASHQGTRGWDFLLGCSHKASYWVWFPVRVLTLVWDMATFSLWGRNPPASLTPWMEYSPRAAMGPGTNPCTHFGVFPSSPSEHTYSESRAQPLGCFCPWSKGGKSRKKALPPLLGGVLNRSK